MRYDQTNEKQINEKRNNVYTCNLLLMRNLSLHIGYYQIKSRLDWRQAHTQRSIKSVRFQAVPRLEFSSATVEKPDSQRYVVVNGKRNLVARSDSKGYSLLAWIQNEARSTS